MDVNELIKELEKYHQLYNSPSAGVTLTGGEPLFQPEFLKEILKVCKKHYIHTAIETCGYSSREILESVIPYVDLFLYDLKLFDEDENKKYTGVPSKLIKDNLKFLVEKGSEVILRFPIIPGITDTDENTKSWAEFLSNLKGPKEIDLLPYHDVNEKFYRLGQEYKMQVHQAPSENVLKKIKQEFEKIGMIVKIGG
jgi:pyruvate formate lyase activating enzyme